MKRAKAFFSRLLRDEPPPTTPQVDYEYLLHAILAGQATLMTGVMISVRNDLAATTWRKEANAWVASVQIMLVQFQTRRGLNQTVTPVN